MRDGTRAWIAGACVAAMVAALDERLVAPGPAIAPVRVAPVPVPRAAMPSVRSRPRRANRVTPPAAVRPEAPPAPAAEIPAPLPPAAIVSGPLREIPGASVGLEPPAVRVESRQPPALRRQPPRGGLVPLYVSYGVLQGLDVHSTRTALRDGRGREANPVIAPLADSSGGLVAVKVASTVAVIWGAEKLRKKNRRAAVILMVGINAATAAIVAHNYRAGR